ncbi:hypothetical protein ACOMHN_013923 [Nucella lapillus]
MSKAIDCRLPAVVGYRGILSPKSWDIVSKSWDSVSSMDRYGPTFRGVSPCSQCREKIKRRTDWNGLMQDLFGIGKSTLVETFHVITTVLNEVSTLVTPQRLSLRTGM